jgi:hypothetical protein
MAEKILIKIKKQTLTPLKMKQISTAKTKRSQAILKNTTMINMIKSKIHMSIQKIRMTKAMITIAVMVIIHLIIMSHMTMMVHMIHIQVMINKEINQITDHLMIIKITTHLMRISIKSGIMTTRPMVQKEKLTIIMKKIMIPMVLVVAIILNRRMIMPHKDLMVWNSKWILTIWVKLK